MYVICGGGCSLTLNFRMKKLLWFRKRIPQIQGEYVNLWKGFFISPVNNNCCLCCPRIENGSNVQTLKVAQICFVHVLPWTKKKRTILVMHQVISKNLQSDFATMHRCMKSRQLQVGFAHDSAAESSTLIPRYHKTLILCISSMVLFFCPG